MAEVKPKTLKQQLAALKKKKEPTPEELAKITELEGKIAAEDKAKADEAKRKKEEAEKNKFKEADNDFQDYQKFAELKFLQWRDGQYVRKCLKPKTLEQFDKLEKKFKDYPGKKPIRDKTVSLDIENKRVRIVEGYGVPESIYKLFKDSKTIEISKYFE